MANVKGNALPAAASIGLTDIIIIVDPTTGVAYKATVAEFIADRFGVENSTTVALTEAELDLAYPGVSTRFEVLCPSITDGPMLYKKSTSNWYSIPLGTT